MRTSISVVICIVSVLVFGARSAKAQRIQWNPNDLSVLMPLPKTLKSDELLRGSVKGPKGELLPRSRMQSFPVLSAEVPDKAEEYAGLRAVGFRIDPCFPAAKGCERQIRIVWQLLYEMGDRVLTLDAAIHTFYRLTEPEYQSLLAEVVGLKTNHQTGGPLWVHPVIRAQGLTGPFAKSFHAVIQKYAGDLNLVRMTFMLVRGPSIVWAFGGVDIDNGVATTISIPRLGGTPDRPAKLQTFINRTTRHDEFRSSDIRPAPAGADTFNLLVRDSLAVRPVEDRAEILSGLEATYRIENPNFHNSETADCVSCHTAQGARTQTLTRYPQLGLPGAAGTFAYVSNFDLRNQSPMKESTRNLRAFGYFEQQPALSQRMINEAAAVAELLNK